MCVLVFSVRPVCGNGGGPKSRSSPHSRSYTYVKVRTWGHVYLGTFEYGGLDEVRPRNLSREDHRLQHEVTGPVLLGGQRYFTP